MPGASNSFQRNVIYLACAPAKFLIHSICLFQTVVSRGSDMYLQMLLKDNLMHADLHPGNILVQDKAAQQDPNEGDGGRVPADSKSTRIVLVDAGMVARLTHKEQSEFIGNIQILHCEQLLHNSSYLRSSLSSFEFDAVHVSAVLFARLNPTLSNEC